jgi:hypothetical protein
MNIVQIGLSFKSDLEGLPKILKKAVSPGVDAVDEKVSPIKALEQQFADILLAAADRANGSSLP